MEKKEKGNKVKMKGRSSVITKKKAVVMNQETHFGEIKRSKSTHKADWFRYFPQGLITLPASTQGSPSVYKKLITCPFLFFYHSVHGLYHLIHYYVYVFRIINNYCYYYYLTFFTVNSIDVIILY